MSNIALRVTHAYEKAVGRLQPLAPLALRLSMGALFFASGYGKWHNLERTASFFADLGIPAPHEQAVFIAALECVGGLGLAFGLLTPLWSLLLMSTMVVALATAIVPEAEGVFDVIGANESVLVAGLLILMVFGAGPISVDVLLVRRFLKPLANSPRTEF